MTCARTGCGGTIVDGYCNDCGLAPPRRTTTATEVVPPAELHDAPETSPRRPQRTTTTATRAKRLGAGLVELPPIPAQNPSAAVMVDPVLPEKRRYCSSCKEPVGRARNGQPGRTTGFCPKCRTPFQFAAELASGELVGGQYEVVGCLAHGGLGWVYLARDLRLDQRWVVLKGLLDRGDQEALATALAERRFLAEVEHPNIVKVFNFVEHRGDGYIVMEFVNGRSLRQILEARREAQAGVASPLPVAEAIAYMLEILPALGYLHGRGLLYCDFKPDNVIRTDSEVKLIDLGGVYRADDTTSPMYGTDGYQAPEVAHTGPTVASDLFTVGRTLAVLCTEFAGYQSSYRYTLRDQESVPVFAEFDSLYRLLERATAREPDDRFESAESMSEQLVGVLREVVAKQTGVPAPGPSHLFASPPPTGTSLGERPWRALPTLNVDPADPGAGALITLGALAPKDALPRLDELGITSIEVELWRIRLLLELGTLDEAESRIAAIEVDSPWEWRTKWLCGLAALQRTRPDDARANFERVYRAVPGELAPKAAIGLAAELAGDLRGAVRWYEPVWRTDPNFAAATFGLARCRQALGDAEGAIAAYERIDPSSSARVDASRAQLKLLLRASSSGIDFDHVLRAAALLDSLALEGEQRERLELAVFEAAFQALPEAAAGTQPSATVLGRQFEDRALRLAIESSYRSLARRAPSQEERVLLVDRANRIRPRSLL